jgi:hypothetical protein
MANDNGRFSVWVPVDVDSSVIVGRNGLFNITALQARLGGRFVYIDGIGKRGREIRGGLWVDPPKAIDQLCLRWLEQRGLLPAKIVVALPTGWVDEGDASGDPNRFSAVYVNGEFVYAFPDEIKQPQYAEVVAGRIGTALGASHLVTVSVDDPLEDNQVLAAIAEKAAEGSGQEVPGCCSPPSERLAICQNCRRRWPEAALVRPIEDLEERVDAGENTPAGECPDCGALCSLEEA